MSTGPWKKKQPPPTRQAGPMREISELFLERSALEQKLAANDGLLAAWFRTIGVHLGELPAAEEEPQLPEHTKAA